MSTIEWKYNQSEESYDMVGNSDDQFAAFIDNRSSQNKKRWVAEIFFDGNYITTLDDLFETPEQAQSAVEEFFLKTSEVLNKLVGPSRNVKKVKKALF